jgi:sucrose-6-phosphate hydrolase SacC (GH32 family)
LRRNGKKHEHIQVADGSPVTLDDVRGDCLELDLTIAPSDAQRFGIRVRCSPDGEEQTVIEYDPAAKHLKIDVAKSSLENVKYYTFCMMGGENNPPVTAQAAPFALQEGEKLHLQVFLDRSILEVFANGRQCITQRIYPTRSDSLGVVLLSEGSTAEVEALEAWEMAATNPW